MSKLGDLIVRLQLQYDDYKKGLKNATKETTSFGGALGKMKVGAMAVWAAIGGAVIGFSKQMLTATNRVGDAWARFTAQAKGAWGTFLQSLSSFNWNNFIGRIKESTAAAKELQNALDAEFEISNSIRLQKASMAEELAELEVIARDQTKTYKERAAAAQKYLSMVKPLYDQELRLAQSLEDAQLGKWLAGSGLQDTVQVRKDLRRFLVDYGKDSNLMNSLGIMIDARSRNWMGSTKIASARFNNNKAYISNYNAASQYVNDYEKNNGYGTSIYALAAIYEKMRGDADTKPLVDAMIRAGEAAGAFDKETKKMQSALNTNMAGVLKMAELTNPASLVAAFRNQVEQDTASALGEPVELELFEIDMSEVEADMDAFLDAWKKDVDDVAALNATLEDSFIQATSGGIQALTDMMMGIEGADASQVLAALLQPFAQTMISLGEMLLATGLSIEVFKTSLRDLQGPPAIAAGLGLIALGSALTSGIKALGGASSSSASGGGYDSASSSGSRGIETYEQEITVHVVGEVAGDKIVLAGQKTLNKWNR